jgi:hypothetical protein
MFLGNYKFWFQNLKPKPSLFNFMSNPKSTKPWIFLLRIELPILLIFSIDLNAFHGQQGMKGFDPNPFMTQ